MSAASTNRCRACIQHAWADGIFCHAWLLRTAERRRGLRFGGTQLSLYPSGPAGPISSPSTPHACSHTRTRTGPSAPPFCRPLPSVPTALLHTYPSTHPPQVHRHHPPAVYGRAMGGTPGIRESPSTPLPHPCTLAQVHRHHPPAVYGRTMGGAPETSEGAAVYKVEAGLSGAPAYGFITYQ